MTQDSNQEKNSIDDKQMTFEWSSPYTLFGELVENNQVDLPEKWEDFWEDLEDDAHQ